MNYRVIIIMLVFPFFILGQNWSEKSLKELDAEQFRRLEAGEANLEEIPETIVEKSNRKPSIYLINAYTVLGIVNKNRGYYASSLSYYIDALNVAEHLNDEGRVSACLNNIGTLYLLQENYQRAIEYFDRSLKLEENLKNPEQKSIRLYNLGDVYKRLNQLDEAMGYFTASLLIERKLDNHLGIAYALLGQAEVYMKMDRTADVDAVLSKIAASDLDTEGEIEFLRVSGEESLRKGETAQAITLFQKAVRKANESGSATQLVNLYLLLAESFESTGAKESAMENYKLYMQNYRRLQSNLIKNQLEDLTYRNEIQQRELKIRYLKRQQDLHLKNAQAQARLRKYDWRISLFSVLSVVGIIVVLVVGMKRILKYRS